MKDEQFNKEFKKAKKDVLSIAFDGSNYIFSERNIESFAHTFYLLGKLEGVTDGIEDIRNINKLINNLQETYEVKV